jgi:hypothetical protein
VRPGLLTTRGPLILASSAYAKRGALWSAYRKHFGPDGSPAILVAHGTSRDFNPTLPQAEIDRALEEDRARNTAEYLSIWRSDIESFISLEVVEGCVGDYREMMPASGISYRAFVDPASGSGEDSLTLSIAHKLKDRIIIDAVREVRPHFSPAAAVEDLASVVKSYRCAKVIGDHYAGEFPRELFKKHGIFYEVCKLPKSDCSATCCRCSTAAASRCRVTTGSFRRSSAWSAASRVPAKIPSRTLIMGTTTSPTA